MKCVAAATKVIFYPLLGLINFMNPEFTSNFDEAKQNFELILKPRKQVKKTINREFSYGCQ
jgi:hypothetical protein